MSLHRREYLAQFRLALPILGGQLAQTANGFVDTMMAGRVSAEDLAAVAVGASIWVPLFLFMTGGTDLRHADSVTASRRRSLPSRQPAGPAGAVAGPGPGPAEPVDSALHGAGAAVDGRGRINAPAGAGLPGRAQLGHARRRRAARATQLHRGHEPHPAGAADQRGGAADQHSRQLHPDLRQARPAGHGWRGLRLGHQPGDVVHGADAGRLHQAPPGVPPGPADPEPAPLGAGQPGLHAASWPAGGAVDLLRSEHLRGDRLADQPAGAGNRGRSSDRAQLHLADHSCCR